MLPLTRFYRSGAHRSDVYKWDAFVTSWRFYNRAWQPQRHDRLPETSGTLWIHRGALTNQRCSLATGCGIMWLTQTREPKWVCPYTYTGLLRAVWHTHECHKPSVQVRVITPVCQLTIFSKKDFWIKLVLTLLLILTDITVLPKRHFSQHVRMMVVPTFNHLWRHLNHVVTILMLNSFTEFRTMHFS